MAKIKELWVEQDKSHQGNGLKFTALRFYWDNGRHQRIRIEGESPKHIVQALINAQEILNEEIINSEI